MNPDIVATYNYNLKLVELIKTFPCIWNTNLPNNDNNPESYSAWKMVAKKMCDTVTNCRVRWYSLKSELIQERLNMNSTGHLKNPYYLAKQLEFLEPHIIVPRKRPMDQCDKAVDNRKVFINGIKPDQSKEAEKFKESSPKSIECSSKNVNLRVAAKEHRTKNHVKNSSAVNIEWNKRKKDKTQDIDGNQSFLNSLHFHTQHMTEKQFRRFQQKVIALIDEILADEDIPQVIFRSLPAVEKAIAKSQEFSSSEIDFHNNVYEDNNFIDLT